MSFEEDDLFADFAAENQNLEKNESLLNSNVQQRELPKIDKNIEHDSTDETKSVIGTVISTVTTATIESVGVAQKEETKEDDENEIKIRIRDSLAGLTRIGHFKSSQDSLDLTAACKRLPIVVDVSRPPCADRRKAIRHSVVFPPQSNIPPANNAIYKCDPPKMMAKEYAFELDPFQRVSVGAIAREESILVAAHTSAGKTAVAEYAIAQCFRNHQRVIYTSPIKALSNQKYRDLCTDSALNGDVGLMTGDTTVNRNASVLVMTTEILRNMLQQGAEIIREVGWVIFDEIHYMRDAERGVVWEDTITQLPSKVHMVFLSATIPNAEEFAGWVVQTHKQPFHVVYTEYRPVPLVHYIAPVGGDGMYPVYSSDSVNSTNNSKPNETTSNLFSSAEKTVGDEQQHVGRLHSGIKQEQVARARAALPRANGGSNTGGSGSNSTEGSFGGDTNAENSNSTTQVSVKKSKINANPKTGSETLNKIVKSLIKMKAFPVIVFAFGKEKTETLAKQFITDSSTGKQVEGEGGRKMRSLLTFEERESVKAIFDAALAELPEENRDMRSIKATLALLQTGIAVHHAGLLPWVKELTEIMFQQDLVKVLFATETFAMGLNLPARAVVFSELTKFDGRQMRPLTSGEYIQMAGRAGRRNVDKQGLVISLFKDSEECDAVLDIMCGSSEPLNSSYRLSYNAILNLMRTEGTCPEEVIGQSFLQFQKKFRLPKYILARENAKISIAKKLKVATSYFNSTDFIEYLKKYSPNALNIKYGSIIGTRLEVVERIIQTLKIYITKKVLDIVIARNLQRDYGLSTNIAKSILNYGRVVEIDADGANFGPAIVVKCIQSSAIYSSTDKVENNDDGNIKNSSLNFGSKQWYVDVLIGATPGLEFEQYKQKTPALNNASKVAASNHGIERRSTEPLLNIGSPETEPVAPVLELVKKISLVDKYILKNPDYQDIFLVNTTNEDKCATIELVKDKLLTEIEEASRLKNKNDDDNEENEKNNKDIIHNSASSNNNGMQDEHKKNEEEYEKAINSWFDLAYQMPGDIKKVIEKYERIAIGNENIIVDFDIKEDERVTEFIKSAEDAFNPFLDGSSDSDKGSLTTKNIGAHSDDKIDGILADPSIGSANSKITIDKSTAYLLSDEESTRLRAEIKKKEGQLPPFLYETLLPSFIQKCKEDEEAQRKICNSASNSSPKQQQTTNVAPAQQPIPIIVRVPLSAVSKITSVFIKQMPTSLAEYSDRKRAMSYLCKIYERLEGDLKEISCDRISTEIKNQEYVTALKSRSDINQYLKSDSNALLKIGKASLAKILTLFSEIDHVIYYEKQIKSTGELVLSSVLSKMTDLLVRLQHIDEQTHQLLPKGLVACQVNAANEIIISECLFNAIFANLDSAVLAGLLGSIMTETGRPKTEKKNQQRSAEKPPMPKKLEAVFSSLKTVVGSIIKDAGKCGVELESGVTSADQLINENAGLMAYVWASGKEFSDVMQLAESKEKFEGNIIRMLRRLVTLLQQVIQAVSTINEKSLLEKLMEAEQKVCRGIVNVKSLYIVEEDENID